MDGTRPWIARALVGAVALVIAAGLFALASVFVSTVMPLAAHLHVHAPRIGVFIAVMSSMTSMGIVMWVVFTGGER